MVCRFTVALLISVAMTAPAWSAGVVRALKFPKGATAIIVKGTFTGRESRSYVIEARAGQTLQTLFSASSPSCYFNVFEPGSPEAAHIGSIAGNEFGRSPTRDGIYKLQV